MKRLLALSCFALALTAACGKGHSIDDLRSSASKKQDDVEQKSDLELATSSTQQVPSRLSSLSRRFIQIPDQSSNMVVSTFDDNGKAFVALFVDSFVGWIDVMTLEILTCQNWEITEWQRTIDVQDCTPVRTLASVADGTQYPNGARFRSGNTFYYPDGAKLASLSGYVYYRNGYTLRNSSATLYWSSASTMRSSSGAAYFPNGASIYANNDLYYQSGAKFVDDMAIAYYGNGAVLRNSSGSLYYSSNAKLRDQAFIYYPDGSYLRNGNGDLTCSSFYGATCLLEEVSVQLVSGAVETTINARPTSELLVVLQRDGKTRYVNYANRNSSSNPPPATDVAISNIAVTEMTLDWRSGGGTTTGFRVAISAGTTASIDCAGGRDLGMVNSFRFTGLRSNTTYTAVVCALGQDGAISVGVPATGKTLPMAPPPAPTNMRFTTIGSTSLAYAWNNGGGTTSGYYLSGIEGTTPLACKSGGYLGSSTSKYTTTGLKVNTTYTFAICAINGEGVFSPQVTITGKTSDVAPPNPSNLVVATITANTIKINWTSGGGSTRGFKVASAPNAAPANCSSGTDVGNVTTATIGGLAPLTNYGIRICAYSGTGLTSAGVTVSGKTIDSAPPAVIGLAATTVNNAAITVAWSSGGGTTSKYQAAIAKGTTAPACTATGKIVTTAATTTFSGLSKGTTYSISVCALSPGGVLGPKASLVQATTSAGPPPNPTALTLSATKTSVASSWASGGGTTSAFIVAYASGLSAPSSCASGANIGNATSYSIPGLKSKTYYSVRVCARDSAGNQSAGVTKSIRTK